MNISITHDQLMSATTAAADDLNSRLNVTVEGNVNPIEADDV